MKTKDRICNEGIKILSPPRPENPPNSQSDPTYAPAAPAPAGPYTTPTPLTSEGNAFPGNRRPANYKYPYLAPAPKTPEVESNVLGPRAFSGGSSDKSKAEQKTGRIEGRVFPFPEVRLSNEQKRTLAPEGKPAPTVSDIDADPVWGEAVDGLQLAVSGIRQDRHFKSADTIRFRLSVRNVGREPILFQYHVSKMCYWIAPHVETAKGEHVKIQKMIFRGGHKIFTETLEPKAEVSLQVAGILVLGESDMAEKNWPRIETPEPGKYTLRSGYHVYPLDANGERTIERDADGMLIARHFNLSSGTVVFHID